MFIQMLQKSNDSTRTVVIFLMNGISSVLGWNSVIATMDYFQFSFLQFPVYSLMPVAAYAGYLVVGFSYHLLSNKLRYINLIIIGNVVTNIALGFVLIVSVNLSETVIGFILILLGCFLIGVSGNFSRITFYAMVNYLSDNVVSYFTIGAALSGLFIAIIRVIIMAIGGAHNKSITTIVVYFLVAIIINTVNLFMNISFCRSEVYHQKIAKFLPNEKQAQIRNSKQTEATDLSIISQGDYFKQSLNEAIIAEQAYMQKSLENKNYLKTMYQIWKILFPFPFLIVFNYAISFMLYPGPIFSITFVGFDQTWSIITFVIIFNIGDTLGRFTANINNFYNKQSLIFVFVGRLVFIYTITLMACGMDQNDVLVNNLVFPYVNCFLFSFTNGFCLNAASIIAFKSCPVKFKKYAGVLCGLALQVGIMIGTIFEIPYAYAIGIN